jgi:hypothetical protein
MVRLRVAKSVYLHLRLVWVTGNGYDSAPQRKQK